MQAVEQGQIEEENFFFFSSYNQIVKSFGRETAAINLLQFSQVAGVVGDAGQAEEAVRRPGGIVRLDLLVTTEKVGEIVFLRIDRVDI